MCNNNVIVITTRNFDEIKSVFTIEQHSEETEKILVNAFALKYAKKSQSVFCINQYSLARLVQSQETASTDKRSELDRLCSKNGLKFDDVKIHIITDINADYKHYADILKHEKENIFVTHCLDDMGSEYKKKYLKALISSIKDICGSSGEKKFYFLLHDEDLGFHKDNSEVTDGEPSCDDLKVKFGDYGFDNNAKVFIYQHNEFKEGYYKEIILNLSNNPQNGSKTDDICNYLDKVKKNMDCFRNANSEAIKKASPDGIESLKKKLDEITNKFGSEGGIDTEYPFL